jgi:hypothetical protein
VQIFNSIRLNQKSCRSRPIPKAFPGAAVSQTRENDMLPPYTEMPLSHKTGVMDKAEFRATRRLMLGAQAF